MCLDLTSFSINILLFSKNITVCVRVVVQKNKWFDVKEQKPSQVNQAK